MFSISVTMDRLVDAAMMFPAVSTPAPAVSSPWYSPHSPQLVCSPPTLSLLFPTTLSLSFHLVTLSSSSLPSMFCPAVLLLSSDLVSPSWLYQRRILASPLPSFTILYATLTFPSLTMLLSLFFYIDSLTVSYSPSPILSYI